MGLFTGTPSFAFPPLDLQIDRRQYLVRSAEHVSHVPGVRLIWPSTSGEYWRVLLLSVITLFSLILSFIDERPSNVSNAQIQIPGSHVELARKDSQSQNNNIPRRLSMDLAEEIKGMYRLLDLISEFGSNGCGNEHFEIRHPRADRHSP
jgi:hypothetical protein